MTITSLNINSNEKISFVSNNMVCMIMCILYKNKEENENIFEDFELSSPKINSISIFLNGRKIKWEDYEIVNIEFMGLNISVLCIDPQLRDYDKFTKIMKNDFDLTELHTINFSRIDIMKISLNFDSNDSNDTINAYINFMSLNKLQIRNNVGMLKYNNSY